MGSCAHPGRPRLRARGHGETGEWEAGKGARGARQRGEARQEQQRMERVQRRAGESAGERSAVGRCGSGHSQRQEEGGCPAGGRAEPGEERGRRRVAKEGGRGQRRNVEMREATATVEIGVDAWGMGEGSGEMERFEMGAGRTARGGGQGRPARRVVRRGEAGHASRRRRAAQRLRGERNAWTSGRRAEAGGGFAGRGGAGWGSRRLSEPATGGQRWRRRVAR